MTEMRNCAICGKEFCKDGLLFGYVRQFKEYVDGWCIPCFTKECQIRFGIKFSKELKEKIATNPFIEKLGGVEK
jgi:hypothetical protein